MTPASTRARPARRPRHDPRESEREILLAGEQLLSQTPFREVTVERIMKRTGLKRPAFYAHFSDRYELVLRIVQDIGGELLEACRGWLEGGSDPPAEARASLRAVSEVYGRHAPLLGALAEAAPGDARVEQAYRDLVGRFIEGVARKIAADQSAGATRADLHPHETARALVWMNERYLYEALARPPRSEPGEVAATLAALWVSTLYGQPRRR